MPGSVPIPSSASAKGSFGGLIGGLAPDPPVGLPLGSPSGLNARIPAAASASDAFDTVLSGVLQPEGRADVRPPAGTRAVVLAPTCGTPRPVNDAVAPLADPKAPSKPSGDPIGDPVGGPSGGPSGAPPASDAPSAVSSLGPSVGTDLVPPARGLKGGQSPDAGKALKGKPGPHAGLSADQDVVRPKQPADGQAVDQNVPAVLPPVSTPLPINAQRPAGVGQPAWPSRPPAVPHAGERAIPKTVDQPVFGQPPLRDGQPAQSVAPVSAAAANVPPEKLAPSITDPSIAGVLTPPPAVSQLLPMQKTEMASQVQSGGEQSVAPADQIVPALIGVMKSTDGAASVTVRLNPVELGHVEIRIDHTSEGSAHVAIMVERPETLRLLLRDQPNLQRALDQAGVPSEGRSLSFQATPPEPALARAFTTDGMTAGPGGSETGGSGFGGSGFGGSGLGESGLGGSGPGGSEPEGSRQGQRGDPDGDQRRDGGTEAGLDHERARMRWFRTGLDITA
jgi:flagellar hook-length control protein FliK